MNIIGCVLALAVLAAAPARADDSAAMTAVAKAFYTTYAALPRAGGIPDAAARARYAPLLSPRLNGLIAAAATAQARFQARNKAAPPLIEGDLFSSLFEGITGFRLGPCAGDARTGRCTAILTHADQGAADRGRKPLTWSDVLIMNKTSSGWKIDDIAYKAGFSFGNTGLLSDTLKIAASEAP